MIRTGGFRCRGLGFNPRLGNSDPASSTVWPENKIETTPAPPFKSKVLTLIRENVRKRKISPRHETEAILPKIEKIDHRRR